MKWRRIRAAIVIIAILAFVTTQMWPTQLTVASLQGQIDGHHCDFEHDFNNCRKRSFNLAQYLFLTQAECDLWAVMCLGQFRSQDAVDALIRVLETKSDIETCDGVLPIRTTAVKLLGDSGNRSAIDPLKRLLEANPKTELSSGASGCSAQHVGAPEITEALSKLER